jgi:hypothetical protein
MNELHHEGNGRGSDLGRRSLCDDLAAGKKVNEIGHRQRFRHVVRDNDGSEPQGIVERADQVGDDAFRDRVQSRKRLVVHDQRRIEGDGPRQRHAPRHAAGHVGRLHAGGVAQADHLQFHQHQVADYLLGQVRLLSQGECDIVERSKVREQRALLEQHAHLPPERVHLAGVAGIEHGTVDQDAPRLRRQHAANEAQDRGLAGSRAAHDDDDLAAWDCHRQAAEYVARVERKMDVVHFNEIVGFADRGYKRGRRSERHVSQFRMRHGNSGFGGCNTGDRSAVTTARSVWLRAYHQARAAPALRRDV